MKARRIGTRQIATCVLGCWLGASASVRVASLAAEEKTQKAAPAATETGPQEAPEPARHAVKGADPIAANPASTPAAEKGPSNQQIADAVATALRAQPQIRGYKLNLEVRDGVVDLLGEVRDAAQRQALVQVVRSVPGVVDVRDQMAGPGMQAAQFQVPSDVNQPIQPTQPSQQPLAQQPLMQQPMMQRPTNQLPQQPQMQPQMAPPVQSTIPSLIGQRDYDQQPTAQMPPMQQPMMQPPMQPYPMPYPQMPYPQMMPQQPMMAHPMMQQPMMQQPMMAPMQTPWGVRYMPVSLPMMAQGQPQFPPAPTPEGKLPMNPMNPMNPNVPAMPSVPRMPEPGASNMPADPYPIATSPSIPDPNMTPPPLPPYAWPTYAPYNNYSRVAYPESYPHQAWPFIGPVYPFPKVPLGWRSVNLTWEDGFWWLGKNPSAHDWWRIRYR